jgi:RNA polymerase sigma-70 factor, ECF subfamily
MESVFRSQALVEDRGEMDSSPGHGGLRDSSAQAQTATQLVSQAVRGAQAGDREALGFLYARYADNIHGYVRSIVHDQHEAEDVTQQVFAKLMHVIGKYEERDVPFFAWILRVARNVAVDHIRQQRLVPVEEVRASDEGGGDPAGGGRMRDLTDALSRLPLAQREVLVLRHFAGYSPPEIAERTGRSEGSIHGLHHRGRRALRADLEAHGLAPVTNGGSRGGERLEAAGGA